MRHAAPEPELWPQWHAAAARPEIDAAIRGLYARLDAAIAARAPTCWQSGKCCHFDAYGHLLYVTGLEIAWFLDQASGGRDQGSGEKQPVETDRVLALPLMADPAAPATADDACPYQVEGKCSTHTIRPLGCRIFFCQQGTQGWQQELYEQFLDELRDLHTAHGLEYRYMEWRAGLRDASAAITGTQAAPAADG